MSTFVNIPLCHHRNRQQRATCSTTVLAPAAGRRCAVPNANRLTVGIMAMVAEEERRAIYERTKAALAAAKARGVKLGGRPESLKNTELGRQRGAEARRARAAARAKDLAPVIEGIRAEGITSDTGIAKALNKRGIPTARGGKWQAGQVQRLERARR